MKKNHPWTNETMKRSNQTTNRLTETMEVALGGVTRALGA